MSAHTSNTTLAEIARCLHAAKRVVVTSHAKPDGDAMGSVLAVSRALAGRGTAVEIILGGPVAESVAWLAGPTPYRLAESGPPEGEPDAILVVDTDARAQLDPLLPWIEARRERVMVIDHHPDGDEVGAMVYVDSTAAAACQILVALLDEMGCELTGGPHGVAEALFAGLATDTGWFRYGSAGAEAFAVGARLLACGVDKVRLFQALEETHRPARLHLAGRALASLELLGTPAIAVMALGPTDFAEAGGTVEDLSDLVNLPMEVGAVRASVLLSEIEPGKTKLSLRSKPAPPDGDAEAWIDVNALAHHFGGGGHVHAAGARVNGSVGETKQKLVRLIG